MERSAETLQTFYEISPCHFPGTRHFLFGAVKIKILWNPHRSETDVTHSVPVHPDFLTRAYSKVKYKCSYDLQIEALSNNI